MLYCKPLLLRYLNADFSNDEGRPVNRKQEYVGNIVALVCLVFIACVRVFLSYICL